MIKYILLLGVLLICIYPLSYAGYNWKTSNKYAAIGCILIVILTIVMPMVLIFKRFS